MLKRTWYSPRLGSKNRIESKTELSDIWYFYGSKNDGVLGFGAV
jgi:hypothetical protein